MADQWEICYIHTYYVNFLTPKGKTELSCEEFIKKYDPAFKRRGGIYDRDLVIVRLLAEGWEPYAPDGDTHYFRRIYQS